MATSDSQTVKQQAIRRIRGKGRGWAFTPAHFLDLGSRDNVGMALKYAANLLGLSEQVPAKVVFLTDPTDRRITVGRQEIILKRTTPKNMGTAGRISGLVIQALRYLGKDHATDAVIDTPARRPVRTQGRAKG